MNDTGANSTRIVFPRKHHYAVATFAYGTFASDEDKGDISMIWSFVCGHQPS